MIPKRAIFFWEGQDMSWLRKQSIETFRALNPTWTIAIIGGSEIPIPGDSTLERVIRSDWARYRHIHSVGGVYFDTDIVFSKPIPDFWMESELILPTGPDRLIDNIAILGGNKGDPWFKLLDEACENTKRQDGAYNYQSFGVQLTNRMTMPLQGRKIQWVSADAFLPVPWHRTERLWSDGNYMSPMTYGVHWYGGDWTSISFEQKADESWLSSSNCIVAQAIKQARNGSGELEAHRGQLGV